MSLMDRYSLSLHLVEQLGRDSFVSEDERKLLVEMLQLNLDWAVERFGDESVRRIGCSAFLWRPPCPTSGETWGHSAAGAVFKLNRCPPETDWEPVIKELLSPMLREMSPESQS